MGTIATINASKNSEEDEGQGVLVLLGEFVLHAMDSCAEEEGDEVFVSAFCADLLEGCDVGGTVFKANDEQGMIGTEKDEVREQATRTAIAIAEGMQVFVVAVPFGSDNHRMLAIVKCLLRRSHQVRHTGYQRLVVTKDGIASSHILCGVFTCDGSRRTIAERMLGHQSVYLFQQRLVEGMV